VPPTAAHQFAMLSASAADSMVVAHFQAPALPRAPRSHACFHRQQQPRISRTGGCASIVQPSPQCCSRASYWEQPNLKLATKLYAWLVIVLLFSQVAGASTCPTRQQRCCWHALLHLSAAGTKSCPFSGKCVGCLPVGQQACRGEVKKCPRR
jgi:hypothetical protein